MKETFVCDRTLRELFQMDRSSMLEDLTGGVPVREFLNAEFPQVIERRADLVAPLEDESIFHFEIQAQNDEEMAYRAGIYCLMIAQAYRHPVNAQTIEGVIGKK